MAIILYNPKAKNTQTHQHVKNMRTNLLKRFSEVTLIDITQEDDLKARLSSLKADDYVVLMGGDGTIHHFVNQVYDLFPLPFPIHLSPMGSGNDFYRTLKKYQAPTQLFQMTLHGTPHYFVNGMGIGIDGEIGIHVNKDPKKRKSTYLKETFKALIRYIPETVHVEIDGHPYTFHKAYLVVGSNGQYFGSGMRIAPHANPEDQSLEIVIAHNISRLKILLIFLTIYLGQHTRFKKHIFTAKGSSLTVTFETPKVAQMDGECFENIKTLTVGVAEKKAAFRMFR